jgi:hypothetical protein
MYDACSILRFILKGWLPSLVEKVNKILHSFSVAQTHSKMEFHYEIELREGIFNIKDNLSTLNSTFLASLTLTISSVLKGIFKVIFRFFLLLENDIWSQGIGTELIPILWIWNFYGKIREWILGFLPFWIRIIND